ncbi:MAG: undecaprenyl diphosphate synthase family protein [Anaerolineae bacterium]|nr:undecaprenyl diphosphate synthase family protein [Anaerolineae bacterium]
MWTLSAALLISGKSVHQDVDDEVWAPCWGCRVGCEREVALVDLPTFRRIPRHVAFIPDGNRRWAQNRGLRKEEGYASGLAPGFQLYDICRALGIEELTVYGFTSDNTKRPPEQTAAFRQACVDAVAGLSKLDASLLVVGNDDSPLFPPELKPYRTRQGLGDGTLKVNFLVNYDWRWDLSEAATKMSAATGGKRKSFTECIGSAEVSRIDLVVRWGGRRRLSGLLPVQAVYADFYIIDDFWPDFKPEHFFDALRWYESQDVTLGG